MTAHHPGALDHRCRAAAIIIRAVIDMIICFFRRLRRHGIACFRSSDMVIVGREKYAGVLQLRIGAAQNANYIFQGNLVILRSRNIERDRTAIGRSGWAIKPFFEPVTIGNDNWYIAVFYLVNGE